MRCLLLLPLLLVTSPAFAGCLRGWPPRTGRAAPQEMYAWIHDTYPGYGLGSALARARIIEQLPSLFPDVSDSTRDPHCERDWVRQAERAVFIGGDFRYNRASVAWVRSLAQVSDIAGVMDDKARVLRRVLALSDQDVGPYRLGPDELGPAPAPALIRHIAAYALAFSGTQVNVPGVHRELQARAHDSSDDTERLILQLALKVGPDQRLQPWDRAVDAWGRALRETLRRTPDPVALALVLAQLQDLRGLSRDEAARVAFGALADEIISAQGAFPLTEGDAAAQADLVRAALAVRYTSRYPGLAMAEWPEDGMPQARIGLRARLFEGEPAGGRVPEATARRRLAELDRAVSQATTAPSRCALLAEIPRWMPEGWPSSEANARLQALIAPAWPGGPPTPDEESVCRLRVALDLEAADPARRAALALSALEASPAPGPLAGVAGRAVSAHPGWIADAPALRAWLEAHALRHAPSSEASEVQAELALAGAEEALVRYHLSGVPDADPALARAILRRWVEEIRATLPVSPLEHVYGVQLTLRRIRACALSSARADVPEIDQLLRAVADSDDGAPVRVLWPLHREAWLAVSGTQG